MHMDWNLSQAKGVRRVSRASLPTIRIIALSVFLVVSCPSQAALSLKILQFYSNLAPGIVHKRIAESEFSIITSSFESLCLPLLEGLLYDNQVVVKKSRYVFANCFHEYVHVADDVGRVYLDNLTPKQSFTFEDPDDRMRAFFEGLSDEL